MVIIIIINLISNSIKERSNESDAIWVHPEQLISLKLKAKEHIGFNCAYELMETFLSDLQPHLHRAALNHKA